MASSSTMRAAVMHAPGGPEVLKILSRPIPVPQDGQVLIRVKAFGLNRSEMFTRQGHSPGIQFPRILGIEAVGVVASAPGSESRFPKDSIVATAMGGMGRVYDGGYSEYTCVPASQVQVLPAPLTIPWSTFGALPEMMQTAYGSLSRTLRLQKGDRLLIRGGTTSVGLAAAAIAKSMGAKVAATTRRKDREELLHEYGAEEVLIDDGKIASQIQGHGGTVEKFDKVLELVGTSTLKDSLKLVKEGGICCVTGIVGGKWEFDAGDNPMELIPLGVYLSVYGGGPDEFMSTPLAEFVKGVEKGEMKIKVGRTFKLEEVAEAHRCMEANEAGGKIVVLVD